MTRLNESDNDGPSSWRASDKEVAQRTTANLCGDDVKKTCITRGHRECSESVAL